MTQTTDTTQELTYAVEPARLNYGTWCHRANKTIGQGDIAASYSADRIGMNQPIRGTFLWQGARWVCVGKYWFGGVSTVEAYRLVDVRAFVGEPMTYSRKVANRNKTQSDPNGFYHGMTVMHAGRQYVLCGPQARFEPGEAEQIDLFG
jgi:hypothetical protein